MLYYPSVSYNTVMENQVSTLQNEKNPLNAGTISVFLQDLFSYESGFLNVPKTMNLTTFFDG